MKTFDHISERALAEARSGNPLRYIEEEMLACARSSEIAANPLFWRSGFFRRVPFPVSEDNPDVWETFEADARQFESFEEALADGPLGPEERIDLSAVRNRRSISIGSWYGDRSVEHLWHSVAELCPALAEPKQDLAADIPDGPTL